MNYSTENHLTRPGIPSAPATPTGIDGWALSTPAPAPRRAASSRDDSDQPQPLHKIHLLLRGRYKFAITLSILCAFLLAAAGYFLPKPQFRSDGLIEIKPNIPSLKDTTIVMPLYTQYVESQVNFILGQRVIDSAMETPWWKPYSIGLDPKGKKEFAEKLDAEYLHGTFLVRVSFTDPNPERAQAAVKAVIKSYSDTYKDEDTDDLKAKVQLVNTTISNTTIQKKMLQDDLARLSGEYTPRDLEELHSAQIHEMMLLNDKLTQAELSLYSPAGENAPAVPAAATVAAAAGVAAQSPATRPTVADLTPSDLAKFDPRIQQYIAIRDDASDNLEKLRAHLGPQHPQVIDAEHRLDTAQFRLQTLADDVRSHIPAASSIAAGSDSRLTPGLTPEMIHQQIAYLKAKIADTEKNVKELGSLSVRMQALQSQIGELDDKLTDTTKTREQLGAQLDMTVAMNGRVQVRSEGDRPNVPTTDRRRTTAALGFIGGGSIPFIFFMLVGLSDKRYRYSDETSSHAGNVPLLGILPNLPDLLTDPQQAAIAAHCVHQIRTLLQVGVRTHDRHVYAVTSAAPGDGKTSLTLALGLSFANSGSRTLLIDCDLVGSSLSRRLGVRSPNGILESMSSRSPLDFVQPTDINELSILPVGSSTLLSSASFSPTGLRKLITEARKSYDIVLIDTGPILGSIEAPSVAATADATILCVSRGQHRPAVDRSLHHLLAIGAKMAGIVFNRAESRDFEKSVSRFSQRSIRSTDDHHTNGSSATLRLPSNGSSKSNPDSSANFNSATVDPLTRSVASEFKNDNAQ